MKRYTQMAQLAAKSFTINRILAGKIVEINLKSGYQRYVGLIVSGFISIFTLGKNADLGGV